MTRHYDTQHLHALLRACKEELTEEFGALGVIDPRHDGSLVVHTRSGARLHLTLTTHHADARLDVEVL